MLLLYLKKNPEYNAECCASTMHVSLKMTLHEFQVLFPLKRGCRATVTLARRTDPAGVPKGTVVVFVVASRLRDGARNVDGEMAER